MASQSNYILRSIEPVLEDASRDFPCVILTGPRQAGKTCVLRRVFGASHRYVSLELTDVLESAKADPRGFLTRFSPPVILDEIQHAPFLLPYIKEAIDQYRQLNGRFILTGSQNLLLLEKVNETLAGRAAILKLLPLSMREATGLPRKSLPWETDSGGYNSMPPGVQTSGDMWEILIRGFYPELVSDAKKNFELWHSSYIQTYLERDVRTVRQVGDLTLFQTFLRALAAMHAQLLSLTEISRDIGVSVNTVKNWISVLEATHQIVLLRPYYLNAGKRLVKAPKIYFTDTGTLCHLVGLKNPEHAMAGPMGGPIFEGAVLSEILKTYIHRGEQSAIFFWRTSAGSEVDFVIESGGETIPVEAKLGATARPEMAKGVNSFIGTFEGKARRGYVLYGGNAVLPLAPGVDAMPFNRL